MNKLVYCRNSYNYLSDFNPFSTELIYSIVNSRNSYNYLSDFNKIEKILRKLQLMVAILTITFLISTMKIRRIEGTDMAVPQCRNSYNYLSDFNQFSSMSQKLYVSCRNSYNYLSDFNKLYIKSF